MTLTHEVSITIPGHPAPKGSLRCIGGKGRHQLIEDNPKTKDWRTAVAGWCKRFWPAGQHAGPGQPVGVEATFTLPRGKGHYGTGRNDARVKPAWRRAHAVARGTGDVDKLARLLCDALQDAGVLVDDAQVVELTARKAFLTPIGDGPLVADVLGYPGVLVRLYPIQETP